MHFLRWNSDEATLFNHFGIFAGDQLHYLQVLHCYEWLHTRRFLPLYDFLLVKVNMAIIDLTAFANSHNICYSVGLLCVIWVRKPLQHLRLLWL